MTPRAVARGLLLAALIFGRGATADEALMLRWNECADGGGSANRSFACVDNITTFSLLPTFTLAAPVDSVIAFELVIDVQHAQPALPEWWKLEPLGCRTGNLSADAEYSSLGACADPWSASGIGLVQGWWVGEPRGQLNQARMIVTATTPSAQAVTLTQGQTYYAARIVLRSGNTVGTTPCSGCSQPACLVLNSIRLLRSPGSATPSVDLVIPGPGASNWATWQGGAGAACASVPVRNRTWGALKSLYR